MVAAHVLRCGGCGGRGGNASEHGIASGGAPQPTPASGCPGGHAAAADDPTARPAAGAILYIFSVIQLMKQAVWRQEAIGSEVVSEGYSFNIFPLSPSVP